MICLKKEDGIQRYSTYIDLMHDLLKSIVEQAEIFERIFEEGEEGEKE